MGSTLQHVYAKNLNQQLGYPLRDPQMRYSKDEQSVEPYKSQGLQIGDIGHVDKYGGFNLHFNLGFLPEELEVPPKVPGLHPLPNLGQGVSRQKIHPNEVFKGGVLQNLESSRTDVQVPEVHKFTATSKAGAILILPNGATLFELEDKHLDNIRSYVRKYALEWCKYADRESLYLITAAYKTNYWTLGSFDAGVSGQEIRVSRKGNTDTPVYYWSSAFNVYNQQGPPHNNDSNQAVFIKGFKMTVRPHQIAIDRLSSSGSWYNNILAKMKSATRKWLAGPKIEYFPATNFSEPSHPLDVVNRILLDKYPGIQMAITHDDDWIEMTQNKLPFEELMEEDRVRHFMEVNYTYELDPDNISVCLRRNSEEKVEITTGTSTGHGDGPCGDLKPEEHLKVPGDDSRLVITHMRLESFDIGHVDAGVCVLVQFGTTTRRTINKPHANIIEWDDEITLPSGGLAHVTICGTFQLGSTLGTRDISVKRTIDISNMPGSAYNYKFSFGSAECRSSLLITFERHFSYCESHFNYEDCSEFGQTTTRGFDNFYTYHKDRKEEHLNAALDCFRCAIDQCGPETESRGMACFNLASSEFIQCQANGTYSKLNTSIERYRESLQSRGDNHQDRPATLLLLAQALLSCHGHDYDEFIVEEIEQLLAELPPDDSRDRRTADTILETCRFYQAINAQHPADVDGLLASFERGAYTPPYGYFDRPHLLYKLGFAFWRRFRSFGNLDDLDKSIELNTEALQVPEGHDDQTNIAACLGNSLLRALEARGELADVDTSIGLMELGQKVITTLDGISYADGASAPSEDLQEQVELTFAMAQLREQIQLMSSVERVREQAAADTADRGIENPLQDWCRDEDTLTECKRELGVLLSFLGGEGEEKMRKALEEVYPEWPYKDHKIVATMQALEEHMPYFYTVLARRLRFVVEGWC